MSSHENNPVFFSLIIPCHNEEGSIAQTCSEIIDTFRRERIADYEIVVVSDHCTDNTDQVINELSATESRVRLVRNLNKGGFGYAVRSGLSHFQGECACIVMGDLSDSPGDVVTYYRLMREGWECVFGSRFIKGSAIHDYPRFKLTVNRIVNAGIRFLFGLKYNDITNAFKCYRRTVIEGIAPLISPHFNLTVEMPLKAIVRGYSYTVVPISWTNRKKGTAKFQMKEMGSRYTFSIMYVLLEKWLCRSDFSRRDN